MVAETGSGFRSLFNLRQYQPSRAVLVSKNGHEETPQPSHNGDLDELAKDRVNFRAPRLDRNTKIWTEQSLSGYLAHKRRRILHRYHTLQKSELLEDQMIAEQEGLEYRTASNGNGYAQAKDYGVGAASNIDWESVNRVNADLKPPTVAMLPHKEIEIVVNVPRGMEPRLVIEMQF